MPHWPSGRITSYSVRLSHGLLYTRRAARVRHGLSAGSGRPPGASARGSASISLDPLAWRSLSCAPLVLSVTDVRPTAQAQLLTHRAPAHMVRCGRRSGEPQGCALAGSNEESIATWSWMWRGRSRGGGDARSEEH